MRQLVRNDIHRLGLILVPTAQLGRAGSPLATHIDDAVRAVGLDIVTDVEITCRQLDDDILCFEERSLTRRVCGTTVGRRNRVACSNRCRALVACIPELCAAHSPRIPHLAVLMPIIERTVGQCNLGLGGERTYLGHLVVAVGIIFVLRERLQTLDKTLERATRRCSDLLIGQVGPLLGALGAILKSVVGTRHAVCFEPRHASPGVGALHLDRRGRINDVDGPLLLLAVVRDLDLLLGRKICYRADCGALGGQICRAQLRALDLDVAGVRCRRHQRHDTMVDIVDVGVANLTLDLEIALDLLLRTDVPLVVLIERQRDRQRRAEVESLGEIDRRTNGLTLVVGYAIDLHRARVGQLVEIDRNGLQLIVDLRSACGTLHLESREDGLNRRHRNVVLDAARQSDCYDG